MLHKLQRMKRRLGQLNSIWFCGVVDSILAFESCESSLIPRERGRRVSSMVERLSLVWEIPGSIPGGGLACDLLQLRKVNASYV